MNPVFALPLNAIEGNVKFPVRVPPVKGRSNDACPVRLAVIVPAEKLPPASRATTVLAVLADVALTSTVTDVELLASVEYVPADSDLNDNCVPFEVAYNPVPDPRLAPVILTPLEN